MALRRYFLPSLNLCALGRGWRSLHSGSVHKLIDGKVLAKRLKAKVMSDTLDLVKGGWSPQLVSLSFKIGTASDEAIAVYVRNQRRAAKACGIEFVERMLPGETTRAEAEALVAELNVDPRVTGVIIQRPVPEHLSIRDMQQAVHPLKDVEGMHPSSIGGIMFSDPSSDEGSLVPCTAKAAVQCLKSTALGSRRDLRGLECVVVGHSEIVGKPLVFMLMAEGATVTTCHHMTRDLSVHTRKADAVFVAVGKAGLIRGSHLKPGAALIDIGINAVGDKIVGDADFNDCLPVAGWITPVPGGVGPLTSAILMENTIVAAKMQRAQYLAAFGQNHVATNAEMFLNEL